MKGLRKSSHASRSVRLPTAPALRLGLVGCGFFAQNHFHARKQLAGENVEIVAVCDIDSAKAEAAAKKFDVAHWYSDAEPMLGGQPPPIAEVPPTGLAYPNSLRCGLTPAEMINRDPQGQHWKVLEFNA
jgi:hypothetical protein